MKTFAYSKISFFSGVHEVCIKYVHKQIDFAIVFTDAKAIEIFQNKFFVPLAQSEPLVSFSLFKFVVIYNSVWALSNDMQDCLLDLQLSENKKQLKVLFRHIASK